MPNSGYYTEGRVLDPLRTGAVSLVIYADGSVDIGAWGGPTPHKGRPSP